MNIFLSTKSLSCVLALVVLSVSSNAFATTITQWSFNSVVTAPPAISSPAPSTGTGIATSLGMDNSYTYANGEGPGSLDGSDILSTPGTANPSFAEDTWRIRGSSNAANGGAGKANGWNNSAPNYTQGAEFQVSTVGYSSIGLSFDWYSTTQGVGNLQVRYSLDGTNFQNLGSDYVATSNDYYGGAAGSPTISVDLSSIAGAANDPNFAVELVSVRPVATDSNYLGASDTNYASAAGGDYNNSSGNWRFDNITVTGTAVATPEPASLSVLAVAGITILSRRRK